MPSGRVLRLFWKVNKVKAVLLDVCLLPEAKTQRLGFLVNKARFYEFSLKVGRMLFEK